MYSPRVPGRLYQPFAGLSSSLSRALLRGEELSGRVLRLSVGEEDRAVERRGDRESERVRLGGPVGWSGGVLLVQAGGERVSASIAVDRVLASNAGTPHHHFAHHHVTSSPAILLEITRYAPTVRPRGDGLRLLLAGGECRVRPLEEGDGVLSSGIVRRLVL